MSQQPPYGSDPQQPPSQPPYSQQPYTQQPYSQQPQPGQPGYTPYSQGAYPNPYAQIPQRPNHTTRNVLLIVGAVVLLVCGGIVALGIAAVNNIDDSFESDYVGSENDPITVTEGSAFEIRGFEYDEGWAIEPAAAGDPLAEDAIVGLRATNRRDDEDTETTNLTFSFLTDNEVLGEIRCRADASVRFERSVTLDCTSYGLEIDGYDTIEVYDTSFYE